VKSKDFLGLGRFKRTPYAVSSTAKTIIADARGIF